MTIVTKTQPIYCLRESLFDSLGTQKTIKSKNFFFILLVVVNHDKKFVKKQFFLLFCFPDNTDQTNKKNF